LPSSSARLRALASAARARAPPARASPSPPPPRADPARAAPATHALAPATTPIANAATRAIALDASVAQGDATRREVRRAVNASDAPLADARRRAPCDDNPTSSSASARADRTCDRRTVRRADDDERRSASERGTRSRTRWDEDDDRRSTIDGTRDFERGDGDGDGDGD
jgi:hypothetical protein